MPELVTDPDNGKQYWHILMVDPFNDFKQEVFIEVGAGVESGARASDGGSAINHSHSVVQSEWSNYYDLPGSASGGGTNDLTLNGASQYDGGNQSRITVRVIRVK